MISSAATTSEQLSRQPSIYTLTLAELQNVLSNDPSKSLGSMNVEELMKNICTVEEGHTMAAAMSINGASHHHMVDDQHNNGNTMNMNTVLATQPSLQRLVSLPPELSRSTVEEVWKDIQRQKVMSETSSLGRPRQEDTFGAMTLEDYLVRAGMDRDEHESSSRVTDGGHVSITSTMYAAPPVSGANNHSASMDQALTSPPAWMSYNPSQPQHHHHPHHHHHQPKMVQKTENLGVHPTTMMLATGSSLYSDKMGDDLPEPSLASSSLALSPLASDYPLHVNRKRFAPEEIVYEKTIERRQKRMIKNRESAARSRARKQAYTCELEAEVCQLKEVNARLKQQQLLESRLPETWHSQKQKVVLRRTQSH